MSEGGKSDIRVRVFPSGMIEVYGGDADAVGLVAAAASKGMYRPKSDEGQIELPLVNGASQAAPPIPIKTPVAAPESLKNGVDRSPFYDESVNRYHPAVLKQEQSIRTAKDGEKFEKRAMRIAVGKEITGIARECITRAIGTLMARLVEEGVVIEYERDHWRKAPRVTQK